LSESPYEHSLVSFNWRDEVKKLGLIVQDRMEQEPTIYRSYVIEKLVRILTEVPIALDAGKQEQFNRWKQGPGRLQ